MDLDRAAMLLDDDVVTYGRPRPVPSSAGFVVKKGLNVFSFTSAEMPVANPLLSGAFAPRNSPYA